MRFQDRVKTAFRALKGSTAHPRDPAIVQWFTGGLTASGENVTPATAESVVAVMRAVRLLAQCTAMLPLDLFKNEKGGGRTPAENHPLRAVLRRKPNRWQTPFEWIEMMQGHLALRGNAFSEIVATGGSAVGELVPLHPDRTLTFRAPDKSIAYRYQPLKGPQRIILQDEMFHLRDMTFDGLAGKSRITQHREAIGLIMAQDQHAARLFSNSARPAGILKTDKVLSPEAKKKLGDQWRAAHEGAENAGKTAILEQGLEWKAIGLSAEDAQFLQSRKFSVVEVARIFDIPPHMLMELERSTNNNIEQQSLEFVTYSLLPWLTRWEQRINLDLIPEDDVFARFNVSGLLRGDFATRMKGYAAGRQWGWLSADDIRALEEMNPLPDDQGKIYLSPQNMAPAGLLEQLIEDKINNALENYEAREPAAPVKSNGSGSKHA